MLCRPLIVLLLVALLVPTNAIASDDDTLFWVGLGSGLTFFNDTDPDPLEDLATVLSIQANDPASLRRLNFDDKGYEIPIDARFGWKINDTSNVWGMFQRLPYVIEGPVPKAQDGDNLLNPPDDSITLRVPANVFGGGIDFRLGTRGYGSSLILSFGGGYLEVEGYDSDVWGLTNYVVNATGYMWEVSLLSEIDFGGGLYFYPYVAFRSAHTTDATASYVRSGNPNQVPDFNDFEIDYTGVTVGLAARFKVFPFDVTGGGGRGGRGPWDD